MSNKLHYVNENKLSRARSAVKAVETDWKGVPEQASELSLARQKEDDLEGEELVYWVYKKLGGSFAESGVEPLPEKHQPEEESEEEDLLECDNCGKEYKSEHYFEQHVKDCDE